MKSELLENGFPCEQDKSKKVCGWAGKTNEDGSPYQCCFMLGGCRDTRCGGYKEVLSGEPPLDPKPKEDS